MILLKTGPRLRMRKTAAVLVLTCAIDAAAAGVCHAQLPPPKADPMAISVGVALVVPIGNLAEQNPDENTVFATSGTALTQRFSYSPLRHWGVFVQASFPAFGIDVAAADRFSADEVVEGGNDIAAWNLGIRWRSGKSWQRGLYAEMALGGYRHRLEAVKWVERELPESEPEKVLVRESLVYPGDDKGNSGWAMGWSGAVGWVIPLTPAFAIDVGLAFHEFEAEFRHDPYVDRWTNRWIGLRLLAVMTFGGDR